MKLDIDEARQFFADFFYGEHHLPSKIFPFGEGWYVYSSHELATTDYNDMTRLVLMAHARSIRVSVRAHNTGRIKIILHKRLPDDERLSFGHPSLENAIQRHEKWKSTHDYTIISEHKGYVVANPKKHLPV